jgi:hypothetical protein
MSGFRSNRAPSQDEISINAGVGERAGVGVSSIRGCSGGLQLERKMTADNKIAGYFMAAPFHFHLDIAGVKRIDFASSQITLYRVYATILLIAIRESADLPYRYRNPVNLCGIGIGLLIQLIIEIS